MSPVLSKTRFRAGQQCVKKMWLDYTKTVEPSGQTASDQLNFERGREVGRYAREKYGDHILVHSVGLENAARETMDAINAGCKVIAEATFIYEDLAARVDILERVSENQWTITEVKMSGELKTEHVPDVAFQKNVAELCGFKISNCYVVHLNKQCAFPDLSNLFTRIDVTDAVNLIATEVLNESKRFVAILNNPDVPAVRIGKQCMGGDTCYFKDHCWKAVPFHSVFTIPRIGEKKLDELLNKNIMEVIRVPFGLKLTEIQQRYVDLIKGGIPIINKEALRASLTTLRYPLYFLDFEADRPPIPQFPGMHPFDLLPFQFSLHILEANGTLSHRAFLHIEKTDPRKPISAAIDASIGDLGSVVVYNKSFEKMVLEYLASVSPEHSPKLLAIRDRLWDQLDLFKESYMHPGFAGSNSLKIVLETLVPALSYSDMEVRSGDGAIASWVKMLKTTDQEEQMALKAALEAYCRLDSLAMVEIHKHISTLISG